MTVEVILHGAILREAIHVNDHQEEDDMMTMAETMEEGPPHHHEDDWMMDMGMDRHLRDEHPTIMIRMTGGDHLHQVATQTHTEVGIHMLGQEVHHQDMAVAAMVAMRMEGIQEDIGKFSKFLLLTDTLELAVMSKH